MVRDRNQPVTWIGALVRSQGENEELLALEQQILMRKHSWVRRRTWKHSRPLG
jgi:hypothetical protein